MRQAEVMAVLLLQRSKLSPHVAQDALAHKVKKGIGEMPALRVSKAIPE
jgi:hypothetical protein